MTSNKERIENLEASFTTVQTNLNRLELGFNDKLQRLEDALTKLTGALISDSSASGNDHNGNSSVGRFPDNSSPGHQYVSSRLAKLEFPKFAGDDPTEWLNKVQQFFTFQNVTEANKVSLASFHLEGEANQWWQWLLRTFKEEGKEVTWLIFEEELWARFGPTDCEDFDEALSRVRQLGSLRDYQREFEKLGNRVQGWTQKALVGTFMGGLQPEIAEGIRMFKPKSLKDAISLARMRDDQLSRQQKCVRPYQSSRYNVNSALPVKAHPTTPMKRLSWEEMQRRRTQGLCFNCDEKFSSGHRCRKPQLLLLEGDSRSSCDDDDEESFNKAQLREPAISMYALTGWSTARTMRVTATICDLELDVLIDSGSTHNFISEKMATWLQLPVIPTEPFTVKVANGAPLKCQGRFENVHVLLQGIPFSLTLYSLPLIGLDLVLGVQWLEKLGTVICNWKQMTMKFRWNNHIQQLQGADVPSIQAASLKFLSKELRHGTSMFAMCFQTEANTPHDKVHPNMEQLLQEFSDIFHEPTEIPPTRDIDHRIPLKDGTEPINVRPYRYAYFQKAEIEKQVHDMLTSGLIRSSTSPFSSPVLLVKKKDGTWRFCTDYRALNAATIKDRFPIPTVDDMLDELHGAKFFTKLDLRAGYHQVRVHPPDIHKTAFRTHNGHYEYLVMPFGLCNAPSTFQAVMNSIFRPYLRKFVLVFFYDILIYSPDWSMHLAHVRTTFAILRQHQFFVKLNKCAFGQHELEYLGHIVTPHGVKVDQKKIRDVLSWPKPTNISELRGFLGLTGYYRKFVRDYGILALPLTNLLKKGQFHWSAAAEAAFETLKKAMTTTPTLAMPNFNDHFIIECDASGDGIGAVLTQQGKPIAFMSRALGVTKRSWSTYAREMLAIVQAIQTWRPYLLGRKFYIQTDQRSLKYFLEQRIVTPEQQKWVSKLLGYDYEILYKPGKENSAADALSRVVSTTYLAALTIPQSHIWDEIRNVAVDHPYMKKIGKLAREKPGTPYAWRMGLVFYKNRVVVPPNSDIIRTLLREFHDSQMGGHSGVLRTYKRLAQQFYWPSMHRTIREYVSSCDVCQRTKSETLLPAGLLQPLPIPCQVWEDITMDFIEGLPPSNGKNTILVVVDRLSKSAHFIALTHPFTAKIVAEKFVEFVVRLHGLPRTIISDRDSVFLSSFWREFFKLSGTQLQMSSAYHPQTDGQSEVVNRCLEQYLRSFVHQQPRKWSSFLSWAEFWYNTTYHSSIGMTPFQALYGRFPPTIPHYELGMSPVHEVDQQLATRDELLRHLKANLCAANNRMQQLANSKRRDVEFKEGDWVFLKLHPYRQRTVFARAYHKLASRFYGPYLIEQKLGKVAYKLKLPEGSRIHPVFHVSLLKKKLGDTHSSNSELPLVTDGEIIMEPECILDSRWIKQGSRFVEESLVQWKHLSSEDATWENTHQLRDKFPSLNLEDKVPLAGGSIDKSQRKSSRIIYKNPKYR
ncbi:hypothetical protein GQ457_18G015560 [Hibiscus cannabinus]